jgi:hypothetical protein
MATYDVRKQQQEEITEIQFNDSFNRIVGSSGDSLNGLTLIDSNGAMADKYLADFDEIDNLIAALKKAKELWG